MIYVSDRTLDRIYSLILLAVVLLSWGYVIYGTRIAAQWQLDKKTEDAKLNAQFNKVH